MIKHHSGPGETSWITRFDTLVEATDYVEQLRQANPTVRAEIQVTDNEEDVYVRVSR